MDEFKEMLLRLSEDPSLVSARIATQTAFMVRLMMLACTLDHKLREGGAVRLMVLYPTHGSERESSFALRVARLLKLIWASANRIAGHVLIDSHHQSLPDDLVAWVVLSRRAIVRAYLAGEQLPGILPGQIRDVAHRVYVATANLGPTARDAEIAMFRSSTLELELRTRTQQR
jgi:hypothetical protein